MKTKSILVLLTTALGLVCLGAEPKADKKASKDQTPAVNAAATIAATATKPDAPLLTTGDKLKFRIKEDPNQPAPYMRVLVSSTGEGDFPIASAASTTITLTLRGKTLAQAKEELVKSLLEDYYHKVTVDMDMEDRGLKAGQVVVTGAIRGRTVTLPLAPGEKLSIWEAVMKAGPDEFAKLNKVKIFRVDPNNPKPEPLIVDVEKISKGDRTLDIQVQDGDRIDVPEKSFTGFGIFGDK